MVEPVDQPGCLFADQGRGEREIELLYDDEAAHRGAKLGIERAQYLRPIVDGESIGPASLKGLADPLGDRAPGEGDGNRRAAHFRSEEHTSELQSLMRISYAVFCLKKKKHNTNHP